MPLVHWFTR